MSTRIDVWTHILPPAYFARLQTFGSASGRLKRWLTLPSLHDLDTRFRIMDGFEGYVQVLTPSLPPLEDLADAAEAAELACLMNDGLAELVAAHPDRFPAFAGAVSLLDPEEACREVERLAALGAAGVQICTSVRGAPLDEPRFQAFFDTVAARDMAIWLHPTRPPTVADYPTETASRFEIWWCFGWPYESSAAMARLVFSGLFDRHPDLRIVTHHLGAMIPFFAGRIAQGWGEQMGVRTPASDAALLPAPLERPASDYFRLFYGDTALSGSAAAIACGLDFFGQRNVLFGTDFPYDAEGGAFMVRETIRALDDLNLPPATRSAIDSNNVLAFLGKS